MSGDFQATKNFSLKSHKINWHVIINCPGNFTSSNPGSISPTGANFSSTEKRVLQWSCDNGEFSKGGTPLVDRKLETLQWEENSALRTPYNHSDRCFNKRLEGILQGSFNRGEMVKGGKAFSHKCSRITGIKICNPNFHKEFVTLTSLEDGLYLQSTAFKNQQANLELSAISSDHNYCRVPSKQVKCQSRLGVQECNRLIRLETSADILSENNQTNS